MESNIVGRQKQIKALQEAYDSDKPEMVALVGRRRVGKTFLIKQYYGSKIDFELTYGGYGKKVKESLYRLTDFYSHFYLTFIEPLGKSSKIDFIQLSDLPKWKTWSGYTYENVCLAHIDQIRKALGISGVASSAASFVAAPKDGLPGAQIDLLIDRNDQSINLCEIKFSVSEYEVTKQDAANFASKKNVFRYHTKTNKHLFLTLITSFGAVANTYRLNDVDQVLTLDDLFA